MGQPRKDRAKTTCKTCPTIGGPRIKGQCRKCYGHDYFQKRKKLVSAAERTTAVKAWRAANPERYRALLARHNSRNKWILWRHRISQEEYDQKRAACNGLCTICKKVAARLVLDHDHETGKTRDFICDRCNHLIGYFERTPPEARQAVFQYLERHDNEQ